MKKKDICSLIGRTGLVLAMSAVAGVDANARHLQPAEALSILNAGPLRSASAAPLKLAYTQESESGEAAVYVFDRDDAPGFYVLAADDAVGDIVLGYSHSEGFSQEDMSPGFKWLLEAYSQCVGECAAGGSPMLRAMHANRNNISPMITTTWNQQAPFNNDCPTLSGSNCVTGCVATAMAQVLNYHKYPTQGTGSHSYTWNGTTLSFDYGSTTFDWANMLDNYSGTSNYSQKAAVAKLMYACGVGVDMSYNLNESGATDIRIPYALAKFFNYDKATRYIKRAFFNYYEWEELIYTELAASRPVIYSGQAAGGGHSFICDGYENGYFHINWGWSGLGDGFFLLTDLDPGGAGGGYNYDQCAVVGIQPAVAGSTQWYPIYASGSISATSFNNGKDAKIFNQGGVYNYSPEAVSIDFMLKAVSSAGNEYYGSARHIDFNGMSPNPSGFGGFNLSLPANLANDTYKVYLEFKTPEGNIQPVLFPITAAAYFNLTVNGKNITISDGEPEAKATIRVTDFSPESKVDKGQPAKFIVKISNIGDIDYTGNIKARLYNYGEDNCLAETNINIGTLGAGLNLEGTVNITLNYPEGKYTFRVYDMYDTLVSDDFDFWIGDIEEIPELEAADWAIIQQIVPSLTARGWANPWDLSGGITTAGSFAGLNINQGRVVGLYLPDASLSGEFPVELLAFPMLKSLNLSGNNFEGSIESVAAYVQQNPELGSVLAKLNIAGNAFTGNLGLMAACFPNLTTLDASGNCLSDVYPMISTKVSELNIGGQTIDRTIEYDLSNSSVEDLGQQIPTILLYNHNSQSYDKPLRLKCQMDDGFGMTLSYANGHIGISDVSQQNAFHGESGDTLNVTALNSNSGEANGTLKLKLMFEGGDANFDGKTNILDLQTSIIYMFERYKFLPFNFTAADLWKDEQINVQDIIGYVNMLMGSGNDSYTPKPGMYRQPMSGDARIYVHDGSLMLDTSLPVAAFDITVRGAENMDILNTMDVRGMTVSVRQLSDGFRIIGYSLDGNCLLPGVTAIAATDGAAYVGNAMLSDEDANMINVSIGGSTTGTGANSLLPSETHQLYDLQGRKVTDGTQKGIFIRKDKKIFKWNKLQ